MLLLWLCAAWIVGLLLGEALILPPFYTLGASVIMLVAALLYRLDPSARSAALISLMLFLGMSRSEHYLLTRPQVNDPNAVLHYVNQGNIEIEGTIAGEPEQRQSTVKLVVSSRIVQIPGDSTIHPVTGRLLVYASPTQTFSYGQLVHLSGKLEAAPVLDDFDYGAYLADQDVYGIAANPRLRQIDRFADGSTLGVWERIQIDAYMPVLHLRQTLQASVNRALPVEEASLLNGILLGIKTNLDPSLQTALNRTGLTHIVVVSGYNMVIIAAFLQYIGRRLRFSPWRSYGLAVAGIICFTILTGVSASVLRAAAMVALGLMAPLLGRRAHPLTSLTLVAAVLAAWSPPQLRDISFQLSFGATLGMLVILPRLQPVLEQPVSRLSGPLRPVLQLIAVDLAVTLSAMIMTEPVIAANFKTFSLISPVANLVVLPLVPAAMLAGFLFMLAALSTLAWTMLNSLAELFALVTWALLWLMTTPVEGLAALPFAAVSLPGYPREVNMVYYTLLAMLFLPVLGDRSVAAIILQRMPKKSALPAGVRLEDTSAGNG